MANFGGGLSARPNSTRAVPVKPDPNAPKTKSPAQAIGETANKAGALSDAFMSKPVQLYSPQQVQVDPVTAARIATPAGMNQMNDSISAAQTNVKQAGQLDPNVARYLMAAQQSGQYSPQAMSMMQQSAMGQGPSAAQGQLQAGVDQSIQAQMAAAASRGFSPAAMRGAQMQSAQMQQAAVNQAAQLRAQEQQTAQQAFLQGSLQQEGMARDAALQAGQTTLQQQVASDESKQAAINAYLQGSGQLLDSGTQIATTQAQLKQQAALASQEAMLKASMFNNEMGLNAQQLQQQGQMGYAGLGGDMLGTQMGGYQALFGAQQAANEAERARRAALTQAIVGGLIGAGGAAGAAAIKGG